MQRSRGLPSPSPSDDGTYAGQYPAPIEIEAPPEEYHRLENAAIRGDLDTVISIFEAERLPNTPMEQLDNDKFTSVMHRALLRHQIPVVAYLVSHGVPFEMEHVEFAITHGLHSILPVFLENGWDINKPRAPSIPPFLAYALDNRELTEWFLSHGADPNAQCMFDKTPLSRAVQSAPLEIIELLFEHGGSIEKGQLLHSAIRRTLPDYLQVVQMLIDKCCPINTIQYQNHHDSFEHYKWFGLGTPLYNAAHSGNVAMVELLLRNGADPLMPANSGSLPIHMAEAAGHTAVVELLRPYSVSPPGET